MNEYNAYLSEEELEKIMKIINEATKDEEIANAMFDGGGTAFREIALGNCYHAIYRMINDNIITEEIGRVIMSGLELYAFNDKTPVVSAVGRRYFRKYKETR